MLSSSEETWGLLAGRWAGEVRAVPCQDGRRLLSVRARSRWSEWQEWSAGGLGWAVSRDRAEEQPRRTRTGRFWRLRAEACSQTCTWSLGRRLWGSLELGNEEPCLPPGATLQGSGLGLRIGFMTVTQQAARPPGVAWRGAEPGLGVQWFQHFAAIRPQGATGAALTPPRRRVWGRVRQRVTPLRGDSSPALSSRTASRLAPRSPRAPAALASSPGGRSHWISGPATPARVSWSEFSLCPVGPQGPGFPGPPFMHGAERSQDLDSDCVKEAPWVRRSHPLGQFAPASVTKAHPGAGYAADLSPHILEAASPRSGCSQGVSPRGPSTGHADMAFSLDPHVLIPLYVWVLISSSDKDTGPVGSGSHPCDLIYRDYLHKDPLQT